MVTRKNSCDQLQSNEQILNRIYYIHKNEFNSTNIVESFEQLISKYPSDLPEVNQGDLTYCFGIPTREGRYPNFRQRID